MPTIESVWTEFNSRLADFGSVVLAGGAVRDSLLGRVAKDFDVFILQGKDFDFDKAVAEIPEVLSDLAAIPPEVEWHNSEPFLVATVEWQGAQVQILANPASTLDTLLDAFDWNVCLFGFDGEQITQREQIENIKRGEELRLQAVTFPLSTLRRGFRFSERFKMKFKYEDVVALCAKILENDKKNNAKGPSGNEPDMGALAANTLIDEDITW